MSKVLNLENYLSISPNKLGIYLFDTINKKNLYKDELINNDNIDSINYDLLKTFLDKNIFKIEKFSGKFIENIFIILEDRHTLDIDIGIKKKNYSTSISKEYLEKLLTEANDLFRENYQNEKLMHMIVKKYLINDKSFSSFYTNLEGDNLALEIQFRSISNYFTNDLNKILESYQIKIIKYLDGGYIKSFFNNDYELSNMSNKIKSGHNKNEVIFIQKNQKKLGFFEKFFQLFS
tara:strand:- start:3197 stop:3898 length:702 start_codon:yes stop_codon:yes gene_type:complete